MGRGLSGHPWGGGRGAAPQPLLPTGSREQCPVSGWHTQTWEHLALPGPSLAEDLKTVCGNPSRPPGLSASMLWILQGQNTETERLASLRWAGNSSTARPPALKAGVPSSCRGGAGNPLQPTRADAVDRMAANTYHQCKGRTLEEEGGVGAMTAQKKKPRSTEVPNTPRVCSW